MSFPIRNNSASRQRHQRNGFTLIELLVVIAILATIAIVVIPSVRVMNEDRKVRDTARVIGAFFAAARERAAVDKVAGVEIQSIANASGNYNLPNMGLVLYQLRGIPPYNGDTNVHSAVITAATVVLPVDEDTPGSATVVFQADRSGTGPALPLNIEVEVGDHIELGISGVLYEVTLVNSPGLDLTDDVTIRISYIDPIPPYGIGLPFKVHRQPVRIESSKMRLPNNMFLNMSLSGLGIAGTGCRDFDSTPPAGHSGAPPYPAVEGSTMIWFGPTGGVSRVTNRTHVLDAEGSAMISPRGPLHLLMCSGDGDDVDLTNLNTTNFMKDANNLWIVIDNRNGSVTIGKMAEFNQADARSAQIEDARSQARNRRSATP